MGNCCTSEIRMERHEEDKGEFSQFNTAELEIIKDNAGRSKAPTDATKENSLEKFFEQLPTLTSLNETVNVNSPILIHLDNA